MENAPLLISVVIPFYKGNRYMDELLMNLNSVRLALTADKLAEMEVIIVNDSPDVAVEYHKPDDLAVHLIQNEQNMGIHASRIHGIRHARGEWIQLLDQDDLLIPEHYANQVTNSTNADVVVGNCYYYYGENKQLLYNGKSVMEYLITENRFLYIRNLIASPGHCLIRKSAIPEFWLNNPMFVNGADDYYLWTLMFHQNAVFCLNEKPVYIHRNSAEGNLSFDLEKMHQSNLEMCSLLEKAEYPAIKFRILSRSIVFKYLYDTHRLKLLDWILYADKVVHNALYKVTSLFLRNGGTL